MAMDQLLAMRVFARVVEAGSFTRAADSLQMPKASVTKLIQSLEAHLQVKLLLRTTRRVSVTPDGAAYYERATRLMTELAELDATLRGAQASPRGRLRIDTGGAIASAILLPALPEFRARYPDLQIDLGVTDRIVDLIGENVDCALRGAAEDSTLISRKVGSVGWATCAAPGYLQRRGKVLHPRELEATHAVVGYAWPRTNRMQPLLFTRGDETVTIDRRSEVTVNENSAHVAAALAGLGVVQTLDLVVRPHITRQALVRVLADWSRPPQPIYVVYPPSKHLSAKLRVFVEWVAALMATVR